MKNRSYILLSAIVVLILASLACSALSTEPEASGFYMANDSEGDNQTSVFTSTDAFFVFFDVRNIEVGTVFESRWYALNVEGQDADEAFQSVDYAYEEGVSSVYFQLTPDTAWPESNYRVEIYMDDVKIGEQSFSVQ